MAGSVEAGAEATPAPAYLLGLIFRVPPNQVEESAHGVALRIAAFVVEVGVLILGLNELFHRF